MKYFLLVTFTLLLPFTGWADINRTPLFAYQSWTSEVNIDALGPFFSYNTNPKSKTLAIRPLFSYLKTSKGLEWDVFYPLIRYKKTSYTTRFSFFPFIDTNNNYKEFFLFFKGKTESGDNYGGFFPLYGTLKQRFGKDEIKFCLWPLYIHSKEKDFQTWHILWPFFTWHRGNKRRAFKFLPLYGYDNKEGTFEKYFLLWPIFVYQKTGLNLSESTTYFSIFPLYISETSPSLRSYTFLWPFFRFYRYQDYRHYDFPWPLFSWSKGKNEEGFSLLPLVKFEKDLDQQSVFLFYPIYKYQIEKKKNQKIITNYFFFVDRYEQRYDANGKVFLKLAWFWPFFYYKFERGQIKSYFPAIIPIEDPGFERNWAPIFRIYYHEKDNDGNSYTNWFWGIYTHRKFDRKESYHLFPLFNLTKEPNRKNLSLLGGLIQMVKAQEGKYLRLFYFLKIDRE